MKTARILLAGLFMTASVVLVPAFALPGAIACDATEDDNLCRFHERFDPRSGLCVPPDMS